MPRRRRPVRPVRRPNFQPAPEPPSSDDDDGAPPSFADEPMTVPALGATGPVETRPHWTARNERAQGRRLAQLRRSSSDERAAPRTAAVGSLPTFDHGFIAGEMRRILTTTVALTALLIVLALVVR